MPYIPAVTQPQPQPAPNERFRRNVRGFYAWLGATLLAGAAPIAASRLIHTGTLAGRIGAVALGTFGWIPIIYVIYSIIRQGDEFVRRIHLVAIAMAFAGAFVLISLLDWLVRADWIQRPSLSVVWLGIAILWVVSLLICKRHFERPW